MKTTTEKYPHFIEDLGIRTSKNNNKYRYWLVKCTYCGNNYETIMVNYKRGGSLKCLDCSRKINLNGTKHGLHKHKLYSIRHSMISRCNNPKDKAYKNYGAKGVTVCKEWLDSFESFYEWAISNGWEDGLELDKDKKQEGLENKIYSPNTCTFITHSENNIYKRNRGKIPHKNISYCNRNKRYIVQIKRDGVKHTQRFKTLESAIEARSELLKELEST